MRWATAAMFAVQGARRRTMPLRHERRAEAAHLSARERGAAARGEDFAGIVDLEFAR